ncbi:MAG TPA: 3-oxoacyl-ACP reductase family protein [Polyangiaceae bacterium LLY-WYZ-15_(1-7)]|nr:dehydrogenase [Myxococcales bacterium]MAT24272.1 dehydrogenase [Sandaracinus sp.]HJK89313.1 3-oxoacyl-ACP reductase family protein [Polyangiaceae bacterium LLY-WYZ-15_(1-7)]MBJ74229.1 dehydrogenase [Sandaracinus sp.]HJL04242.1 3-oxoacyl-ACP reductase family protein [Polyangiaceae bacterium LLY-WYZ-15_(1-7)]
MRMQNQVAIVTGAARGIGRAVAERFAREGAKVVLGDVLEEGEAAAAAIRDAGGEACFEKSDAGDKAAVDALVAATVARFGRLDCAVANAAIVRAGDFLELSEEDFDESIRVNLKGAFLLGQAAGRQMKAQGEGGTIINMSSVNAVLAIPAIAPYVVAKGGLAQLTKVEALALAPHGIRVNAIGPGSIGTEMVRQVNDDPEKQRALLSRTPLGRLGEPEEIASIAVFLATEDSGYVTGQTLYADGGRLALNYTVPVPD